MAEIQLTWDDFAKHELELPFVDSYWGVANFCQFENGMMYEVTPDYDHTFLVAFNGSSMNSTYYEGSGAYINVIDAGQGISKIIGFDLGGTDLGITIDTSLTFTEYTDIAHISACVDSNGVRHYLVQVGVFDPIDNKTYYQYFYKSSNGKSEVIKDPAGKIIVNYSTGSILNHPRYRNEFDVVYGYGSIGCNSEGTEVYIKMDSNLYNHGEHGFYTKGNTTTDFQDNWFEFEVSSYVGKDLWGQATSATWENQIALDGNPCIIADDGVNFYSLPPYGTWKTIGTRLYTGYYSLAQRPLSGGYFAIASYNTYTKLGENKTPYAMFIDTININTGERTTSPDYYLHPDDTLLPKYDLIDTYDWWITLDKDGNFVLTYWFFYTDNTMEFYYYPKSSGMNIFAKLPEVGWTQGKAGWVKKDGAWTPIKGLNIKAGGNWA